MAQYQSGSGEPYRDESSQPPGSPGPYGPTPSPPGYGSPPYWYGYHQPSPPPSDSTRSFLNISGGVLALVIAALFLLCCIGLGLLVLAGIAADGPNGTAP